MTTRFVPEMSLRSAEPVFREGWNPSAPIFLWIGEMSRKLHIDLNSTVSVLYLNGMYPDFVMAEKRPLRNRYSDRKKEEL